MISDEFAKLGVPIIDMDIIAHEIVEPGKPALQEIASCFGPEIIDESGRLKRSNLREIIFSDPDSRRNLESILHPMIRREASKAIAQADSLYCVLVIPLLTERGVYPNIDRVLVVDVAPETQISRLIARDNSSREQAEKALTSQISREQRLELADDVLDNSGSPEEARQKVADLHQKYLKLAERWGRKVGSE